uniref:AAA+ ATPase domain-containing protein n=1 Tax=Aplanochytrium stocchinoi TaxID=215587 RepID=A0A7S3LP73_9STRA
MDLKKIFSSTVSCEACAERVGTTKDGTHTSTHTGAVSAASNSLDAVYTKPKRRNSNKNSSSSTPLVYRYRYSNNANANANKTKNKKKRPRAGASYCTLDESPKTATGVHCVEASESCNGYNGLNYYNNNVVIMGAGRLGQSLVGFRSNSSNINGIKVVGVFDNDPTKIGLNIGVGERVVVESEEKLPHRVLEHFVRRGIIAVPPLNAQEAANALVNAGVRLILNYAPINIDVPQDVHIERIDPAVQFSRLAVISPVPTQKSSFLKTLFRNLEDASDSFDEGGNISLFHNMKTDCESITLKQKDFKFNATRALQVLFWQFPLTLEYYRPNGTDSDGNGAKEIILLEQLAPYGAQKEEGESDDTDDEEYDSFFTFLVSERKRERELEEGSVSTATSMTLSVSDKNIPLEVSSSRNISIESYSGSSGTLSPSSHPSSSEPESSVLFEEDEDRDDMMQSVVPGKKTPGELEIVEKVLNVRPSSAGSNFRDEGLIRRSLSSPSLVSQNISRDSVIYSQANSFESNKDLQRKELGKYKQTREYKNENPMAVSMEPQHAFNGPLDTVDGTTEKWCVKTRPDICFKDVAGLDEAKFSLREFLATRDVPCENDVNATSPWRSLLLYGPPGCGKSMVALAAIGEMFDSYTFFAVSATDLIVSHSNNGGCPSVRELFEYALRRKSTHPIVIFIDNVDQLCKHKHLKAELLQQLDALRNNRVLLLAATNLPWDIDIALFRHFEKRAVVPLPDIEARRKIFEQSEALKIISTSEDLNRLASATKEFSASDLLLVVKDALMQPKRRHMDSSHLSIDDFMRSAQGTRPTISREIIRLYNSFGKKFGHAPVSSEEQDEVRHHLSLYS